MRTLKELLAAGQIIEEREESLLINKGAKEFASGMRLQIVALGDVGGTLLTGIRLLGGDVVDTVGIYDLNEKNLRRYEREVNQIFYPDRRKMPEVFILKEEQLFDCDMFIFCATAGVPPIGEGGDVRMAQLAANKKIVKIYGDMAVARGFKGQFTVVSDPVDPLCRQVVDCGFDPARVRGYGLGVMNARAAYYAQKEERFSQYLEKGRAFGPHGADLVIADDITAYNHELSLELTKLAVESNLVTRQDGFKPYIAPAYSSAAISILETMRGNWQYSSVFMGIPEDGVFMGCRNRLQGDLTEIENLPLPEELYARIENAYKNLQK